MDDSEMQSQDAKVLADAEEGHMEVSKALAVDRARQSVSVPSWAEQLQMHMQIRPYPMYAMNTLHPMYAMNTLHPMLSQMQLQLSPQQHSEEQQSLLRLLRKQLQSHMNSGESLNEKLEFQMQRMQLLLEEKLEKLESEPQVQQLQPHPNVEELPSEQQIVPEVAQNSQILVESQQQQILLQQQQILLQQQLQHQHQPQQPKHSSISEVDLTSKRTLKKRAREAMKHRLDHDDWRLRFGESLYVKPFEKVYEAFMQNPEVHCGMCGWLQRWDNVKTHYKSHPMFAHDPFAVSDISQCIYYALGIPPQQQNIGRSFWCDNIPGPTPIQVQGLPLDHAWHRRRAQLDHNTGGLNRATLATLAAVIYKSLEPFSKDYFSLLDIDSAEPWSRLFKTQVWRIFHVVFEHQATQTGKKKPLRYCRAFVEHKLVCTYKSQSNAIRELESNNGVDVTSKMVADHVAQQQLARLSSTARRELAEAEQRRVAIRFEGGVVDPDDNVAQLTMALETLVRDEKVGSGVAQQLLAVLIDSQHRFAFPMPKDQEHLEQLVCVMMDAMELEGYARDPQEAYQYMVVIETELIEQHKKVYDKATQELETENLTQHLQVVEQLNLAHENNVAATRKHRAQGAVDMGLEHDRRARLLANNRSAAQVGGAQMIVTGSSDEQLSNPSNPSNLKFEACQIDVAINPDFFAIDNGDGDACFNDNSVALAEVGYGQLEDWPSEHTDLIQDGQTAQCESVALVYGDMTANIDVDSETFACAASGDFCATAYIANANPDADPDADDDNDDDANDGDDASDGDDADDDDDANDVEIAEQTVTERDSDEPAASADDADADADADADKDQRELLKLIEAHNKKAASLTDRVSSLAEGDVEGENANAGRGVNENTRIVDRFVVHPSETFTVPPAGAQNMQVGRDDVPKIRRQNYPGDHRGSYKDCIAKYYQIAAAPPTSAQQAECLLLATNTSMVDYVMNDATTKLFRFLQLIDVSHKRVTSFASPKYLDKKPLENALQIAATHLDRYRKWKHSKPFIADKGEHINQRRQAKRFSEMVLKNNAKIGVDYVMRHAQFLLHHPPSYLLVKQISVCSKAFKAHAIKKGLVVGGVRKNHIVIFPSRNSIDSQKRLRETSLFRAMSVFMEGTPDLPNAPLLLLQSAYLATHILQLAAMFTAGDIDGGKLLRANVDWAQERYCNFRYPNRVDMCVFAWMLDVKIVVFEYCDVPARVFGNRDAAATISLHLGFGLYYAVLTPAQFNGLMMQDEDFTEQVYEQMHLDMQ